MHMLRKLIADLGRGVCDGPWWSCKLDQRTPSFSSAVPCPTPPDPRGHWNAGLFLQLFPPGFWHGFQSQSEEYVGYSNMPAEISVHCEESKRLWQPPVRTVPGVPARGKPAWAALDWLLPVCVFPSVKSSCEVTTKWMVGNNSKKQCGYTGKKKKRIVLFFLLLSFPTPPNKTFCKDWVLFLSFHTSSLANFQWASEIWYKCAGDVETDGEAEMYIKDDIHTFYHSC